MEDISDTNNIGGYRKNWANPYNRDRNQINNGMKLNGALAAARNYYWMAIDLADLPLDTAFAKRIYLCKWLFYYFKAFNALLDEGMREKLDPSTGIRSALLALLRSQLEMLRIVLVYLGVDLNQSLPSNVEDHLTLPNAQPLELFINCKHQSAGELANLGALKDLMLGTQTVDRQRQIAVLNEGYDVGLPFTVFVCFTDKIVSCTADIWPMTFREHRKSLIKARRERFTTNEKVNLTDLRNKISTRCSYVEKMLSTKDNT